MVTTMVGNEGVDLGSRPEALMSGNEAGIAGTSLHRKDLMARIMARGGVKAGGLEGPQAYLAPAIGRRDGGGAAADDAAMGVPQLGTVTGEIGCAFIAMLDLGRIAAAGL